MKIGNEEKIKRITGYGVGELYETNTSQKIECSKGDNAKILDIREPRYKDLDIGDEKQKYDGATFNFHLYPEDKKVTEDIATKVCNVRKEVIKQLKEQGACVDGEKFKKSKSYKDNNIYVSADINEKNEVKCGLGAGGGTGEFGGLYRYIAAKKNGILYELNFMRFFIDKDKKVNCILKAIQFDRCMEESSGVNCDKGECRICYPTSYRSQAAYLNKIIEENSREGLKSFCYNPDVIFYYDSENEEKAAKNAALIAKAFIDFINKCDGWKKANE